MSESFQGGRLAAKAIAAEGVDAIFTLSGGHVMPIYEGCRQEGVRVLDVRHEQAAAHAAEAYGRMRRLVLRIRVRMPRRMQCHNRHKFRRRTCGAWAGPRLSGWSAC